MSRKTLPASPGVINTAHLITDCQQYCASAFFDPRWGSFCGRDMMMCCDGFKLVRQAGHFTEILLLMMIPGCKNSGK